MIRIAVIVAIVLFGFNDLFSQDTIVKRDNERIICKIKEISTEEIKYQPQSNDIVIGIDKNDVAKIVLSTGLTMNFQRTMDNADNYKDQKKTDIKFRLLSPLYGYSDFTFERSLKPGSSIEYSLGIIGLGKHYNNKDLFGASMRIGYKFIKSPDFYLKGLRYAHLLKGSYFRPEVAASYYKRDHTNVFSTALLFNVGNQWVFENSVVVDLYCGIGYGHSSDDMFSLQYGYSTGANEFPIALSSGFRIGFLIK